MTALNPLIATRLGRVLLHTLCVLHHPAHFGWHWQGILREFATTGRFIASRVPATLAIFCLLANAMVTCAQSFVDWHDSIVATLGRGVDPRNPDTIKPSVAVIDLNQPAGYSGTGEADFTVYFSQHQYDLIRHFALNASLSAKYGSYSGRINFGMVDNTTHSGNTLNFVFVGNRNFGQTHYPVAELSPQFIADVNYFKSTSLSGEALGKAIEERYGTHYYTGYKSAAKVVVIYTFTFESQTTVRSLTASLDAKYNGGVNSASFHTDVARYLGQSDSRVTLNYRFYSSDPIQLPDFPVTAAISNVTQFVEFAAKVENYCKGMDPARGKRTSYVVEGIQNVPGFLTLMDGYSPSARFNTDYDRFLEAYGKLKQWDDTLSAWTIDPRRMSWMNTNGQRLVAAMRSDVSKYRRTMEDAAKRHFTEGTALLVPDDILNYFVNFSRIPLPTISIVRNVFLPANNHLLIGYVNFGTPSLLEPIPFRSLTALKSGVEVGQSMDIFYSEANFTNTLRSSVAGTAEWSAGVNEFLASERWSTLRQDAQRRRIGFFFVRQNTEEDWSYALKDGGGGIIEQVNWRITLEDPHAQSLGASAETELGIGIPTDSLTAGVIDQSLLQAYAITNNGPGAAYGVGFTIPVAHGMAVLSVSGSQGQGTVTNGNVQYDVGPLASGSIATVNVVLVPLRTGIIAGAPASILPGPGLTDPEPTNNSMTTPALAVSHPLLEIRRKPGYVDLSWISDTGLLVPQSAPHVADGQLWTTLTKGITSIAGRKTLRVPVTGGSKFFRLCRLN